jgi:hypothetical protein
MNPIKYFSLISILLGSLNIISAQNIPSYVPLNGLAGWWPFSGNANDLSGNGNTGTVNGALLTTDRFGNANSAYSFDGAGSSILINDAPSLRLTKGTISCWIKFNSTSKMQLLQKINFNNAQNQNYDVEINEISGNILIRGNYNVPCSNVGIPNFCSTSSLTLNDNEWHHYVGIMDVSTQKIYIDGVLIDSWNLTGSMSGCVGGDLLLGRGWASYPLWYDGLLDDLAIFNRALSQQEITELYNSSPISATTQPNTTISSVGFELYQNTPNPWVNKTQIGFHLPEAAEARLTIYDAIGRILYTAKGQFEKGYNVFNVDRKMVDGVDNMYYKVETPTDAAIKQMVFIR